MKTFYVTLLFALVMEGCVSSKFFSEATPVPQDDASVAEKDKVEHYKQFESMIPITIPSGKAELNTDIFEAGKPLNPKTLVIMVPGSGNVSRRGEVTGESGESEKGSLFFNVEWGKALASKGFDVLSYDKRTCNSRVNQACRNNEQKDIDAQGIQALANDLDQIYAFAKSKFGAQKQPVRIVLMSTSQGAQVISLSRSVNDASGVVLFSPVIGDLETMWVSYLARAAEQARSAERNQMINRKESMISFFASLKKGEFPPTAVVRGASVQFWLSWIDATKKTHSRLVANSRPSILLFSGKDPYVPKHLIDNLSQGSGRSKLVKINVFSEYDRNFISASGVPANAFRDVVAFIKTLVPAKS